MPESPDSVDSQSAEERPTGTGADPGVQDQDGRPSSQEAENITGLTPVPSLSWSQIETLLSCGEKYRLGRVLCTPQTPAWWLVGGSTVHAATEELDRALLESGHLPDSEAVCAVVHKHLDVQIAEAAESEPDLTTWDGQGSATKPTGETWWREHSPVQVQGWLDFHTKSDMEIWQMGPDEWAIELDMSVELEGVRFRAIVDRVLLDRGIPLLVDLKTGSRKPVTPFQLASQAVMVELTHGLRIDWGSWFMTRKSELTPPMDLRPAKAYVRDLIHGARKIIDQRLFLPIVSDMCRMCSVRPYCRIQGGDPSAYE